MAFFFVGVRRSFFFLLVVVSSSIDGNEATVVSL